jgi:membrane-bound inhibitor of C-type lysozyme
MRLRSFALLFALAGIALAQHEPAGAQAAFLTYHCQDGSEFVAAFYKGDKTAHLQLDGKAIALKKRISVNGLRYSRGDISVRVTKTTVTLKRGKRSTVCTPG